jgi:hypothetical protein
MTDPAPRAVRLDALDRVPLAHGFWRPVRRPLGITAFGVNAYTADGAGDDLIEPHDEASPGSGRHEEWPEHPRIHYILACVHARAGDRERALHHLRFAAEREPAALEYAATESDFDAIRDDPAFPA